jgi:hypothetical protein
MTPTPVRTPRGYITRRGDFHGTTDDRAGRWYTDKIGEPIDHRGQGYRTRREAIEALRNRTRRPAPSSDDRPER